MIVFQNKGPLLWSWADPYLRMGPRGPGPGRQIFRGGILKKSRLKYGMPKKKKGCPRERNLREIYTENNVGTEFSRYDATGARSWGYCLLAARVKLDFENVISVFASTKARRRLFS